ncbi:MAG: peptidoglycan-associated lipoprotein Pal [Syntrophales bacterium]
MSKKNIFRILFPFLVLALLMGCATTKKTSPVTKADYLSTKMKSGNYIQKVDNFEIIFDKTGSMGNDYAGVQKFIIEKSLVSKFNSYIPDLNLNAGLRTLGQNYADFDVTKLEYGMTKYDADSLGGVIQRLSSPYGDSPLETAISAAGNDLKAFPGKSALVIFTDGVDMGDAPVKAATSVKSQYGDNLCIYTVLIGNDVQGAKILDQIVNAGQCGVSVTGDALANDSAMSDFVERIFLATKPAEAPSPPPPSPPPPPVMEEKKAPEAALEVTSLDTAYFDFDNYDLKPEAREALKKDADWLSKNPDKKIVIEGNCDERGTVEYNLALGQSRADSAAKYLMDMGIAKDRISTISYGKERPICNESNEQCWSKNRRADVVLKP